MKYFLLDLKKLLVLPSYRYSFILIGVIIAFMNAIPLFRNDTTDLSWANLFADSFGVILMISSIAMIIITAQFIAGEYLNRTVQMSLAGGVSRKTFIFGKCFALVKGTYILIIISSLFALLLAAGVSMLLGKFELDHLSFYHVLSSFIFSPLTILPFIMIAFFMTILIRTAVFPIAFLMIYSTIGELLLTAMLGNSRLAKMLDYLPGHIGEPIEAFTTSGISLYKNAAALERLARETGKFSLSPFESIGGIFMYIFIFSTLSFFIFKKQDLSR